MKDTVLAVVIFIVWAIWNSRNRSRFENNNISVKGDVGLIKAAVRNSGNMSNGSMFSPIYEFSVLKSFAINCHACAAPVIKQVDWHPPMCM